MPRDYRISELKPSIKPNNVSPTSGTTSPIRYHNNETSHSRDKKTTNERTDTIGVFGAK